MNQLYEGLRKEQQTAPWEHAKLAEELHRMWELLSVEFKLDVREFALRIDRLEWFVLGHHRRGLNSFGLRHEVAMNTLHLGNRPQYQVYGTLFHEMLHAWQEEHGEPSVYYHHNKEFRDKARFYGLIVDRRGVTEYTAGPFLDLIKKHGVEVPSSPPRVPTHRTTESGGGGSKLKKWSCGCTNVRVAVADFQAKCLKPECGNGFNLAD